MFRVKVFSVLRCQYEPWVWIVHGRKELFQYISAEYSVSRKAFHDNYGYIPKHQSLPQLHFIGNVLPDSNTIGTMHAGTFMVKFNAQLPCLFLANHQKGPARIKSNVELFSIDLSSNAREKFWRQLWIIDKGNNKGLISMACKRLIS